MSLSTVKRALIVCTFLATVSVATVVVATPASANGLLGGCGAAISTFDATHTVCATDFGAIGYYRATYDITWEPAGYWDTTYLVGCTMILKDVSSTAGTLAAPTRDCTAEAKGHRSSHFEYPFGPHQGAFYAQGQYHLVWHMPGAGMCQYDAMPSSPGSTWCGYWSQWNAQSPPVYVV